MADLAIVGMSVDRGGRRVLDDVSFTARAGDLVAIVGPNGAGKSTLFHALLGLVRPVSGAVETPGSFAYVPQRIPAHDTFPATVLDVAAMGAFTRTPPFRRLSARDRALAADAVERVGLGELARTAYGRLSGGQRQRALLARALVADGDVLLLDEPFSGVDHPSEQAILEVLDRERAAGRIVLVATHDLAFARTRCTRAVLLNGRVYAAGSPAQALSIDALRAAYGHHLLVLDDAGTVALDDGAHCEADA